MGSCLHCQEEIADLAGHIVHRGVPSLKLDDKVLGGLKGSVEALKHPTGAIPAGVLQPLLEIAEDGPRMRIDVAASDVVGAPVITIENRDGTDRIKSLTKRQKEVALLINQGLSNREIARRLGISIATVKDHVHAILERLEIASRLALVTLMRG